MYILKYSKTDQYVEELTECLREMSLAFKAKQDPALEELTLSNGDIQIYGFDDIKAYLEKMRGELHLWYFCNC